MFTLKLYRRSNPASIQKTHKVISCHRVMVHEIGKTGHALELKAIMSEHNKDYDCQTYYIGEPEPGMEAHGRDDLHIESGDHSWWGWGLLENAQGNTTEHYRPASYG